MPGTCRCVSSQRSTFAWPTPTAEPGASGRLGPPAVRHEVAQTPLVEGVELDVVPGGLDDAVAADVKGGVVHARPVGLRVPPVHEVTRNEVRQGDRATRGVVLVVGHPGEADAV